MKTLEAISEYNEFTEQVINELKLEYKEPDREVKDQYKADYRAWIKLDEKT